MQLNGDNILKLLGKPDYNDDVLNLLEALGEDRDTIEKNMEKTEEEYGIILGFDDDRLTKAQKADTSGANFLNCIEFYYDFKKLPLELKASDSYEKVAIKLGRDADYIIKDDEDYSTRRYWFFKEKGYLLYVNFEDEKFEEIYEISFRPYKAPSKYGLTKYEPGI